MYPILMNLSDVFAHPTVFGVPLGLVVLLWLLLSTMQKKDVKPVSSQSYSPARRAKNSCPHCGFKFKWDGKLCGHCHFQTCTSADVPISNGIGKQSGVNPSPIPVDNRSHSNSANNVFASFEWSLGYKADNPQQPKGNSGRRQEFGQMMMSRIALADSSRSVDLCD